MGLTGIAPPLIAESQISTNGPGHAAAQRVIAGSPVQLVTAGCELFHELAGGFRIILDPPGYGGDLSSWFFSGDPGQGVAGFRQ
jgi:hypothetical protein